MWRCDNGTFRIDGAWGQWAVIAPEKNVVIAVNCLSQNGQAVLRYVMKDIYDKI